MSLSKPATGKRKVDDDHRKFIERWEMEYFFMEYRGSLTCLMCKYQLAGVKRVYGNIRCRYLTLHAEECRNANYIFFKWFERNMRPPLSQAIPPVAPQ